MTILYIVSVGIHFIRVSLAKPNICGPFNYKKVLCLFFFLESQFSLLSLLFYLTQSSVEVLTWQSGQLTCQCDKPCHPEPLPPLPQFFLVLPLYFLLFKRFYKVDTRLFSLPQWFATFMQTLRLLIQFNILTGYWAPAFPTPISTYCSNAYHCTHHH